MNTVSNQCGYNVMMSHRIPRASVLRLDTVICKNVSHPHLTCAGPGTPTTFKKNLAQPCDKGGESPGRRSPLETPISTVTVCPSASAAWRRVAPPGRPPTHRAAAEGCARPAAEQDKQPPPQRTPPTKTPARSAPSRTFPGSREVGES